MAHPLLLRGLALIVFGAPLLLTAHREHAAHSEHAGLSVAAVGGEKPWDVIARGGAKPSDVAQGSLGTCYFLAALIAVADRHPDILRAMFDEPHFCQEGHLAYRTKWLLNGKPTWVAVDAVFPYDKDSMRPWFVRWNDGYDIWPMLLEKAWAKVHGSFSDVEGGRASEVFEAITQAPVWQKQHQFMRDPNVIWERIREGGEKNYPMSAGTVKNAIGLPHPHAYAVLKAETTKKYGKVVQVFNPWSRSLYRGAIEGQDLSTGRFWVTMEELFASFSATSIAEVRPGYSTSSHEVPITAEGVAQVWATFDMDSDKPFVVTLRWPSNRLVRPCKVQEPGEAVTAPLGSGYPQVEIAGGRGKYQVFVSAEFSQPSPEAFRRLYINVYADNPPTAFQRKGSVHQTEAFLSVYGIWCRDIAECQDCKTFHLNSNRKMMLEGMPTFSAQDGEVISWSPNDEAWMLSATFELARRGRASRAVTGSGKRLLCRDGERRPSSLVLETAAELPQQGGSFFEDDLQAHQRSASSAANSGMCTPAVPFESVDALDNAAEIRQSGKDPRFPPTAASIGSGRCGDTAQSEAQESCSKYNHWATISLLMEQRGRTYDGAGCKRPPPLTGTVASASAAKADREGAAAVKSEAKAVIAEASRAPVAHDDGFSGKFQCTDDYGLYGFAYGSSNTKAVVSFRIVEARHGVKYRMCAEAGNTQATVRAWCSNLIYQGGRLGGELWDGGSHGQPMDGKAGSHKPAGTRHGSLKLRYKSDKLLEVEFVKEGTEQKAKSFWTLVA